MAMIQLAVNCFAATQHVVLIAPASPSSPHVGKVIVSFVNGETRWIEPSDGQSAEELAQTIAQRVHEAGILRDD
jgi:hypothetical protein